MRVCPQCSAQYADDTLSFCLNDGTPLVNGPQADTPTVVLGETETFVARSGSGVHAQQPSEVTRFQTFEEPAKSSNTALAVVATVLGMLIVFGAIGLAIFLYFNSGQQSVANANTNVYKPPTTLDGNFNASSPVTNTSTPASPIPTVEMPQANANIGERPGVVIDEVTVRSEVSQTIYGSKLARDSRNLGGYMEYYANTLDRYYNKRGMSRSGVREDKARHFSNYTSMQSNYSNMSIAVGPDGQTATAVFDKEWNFSGAKNSSGKVRSELGFRRINGRWLIVSEWDRKIYYVR